MTLEDMLESYGGNVCITIQDGKEGEKYCEEVAFDYYKMPVDYWGRPDEDALSDDNPNHYQPSCIVKEPWWDKVKDRNIQHWNVIGGGIYKIELYITLDDE